MFNLFDSHEIELPEQLPETPEWSYTPVPEKKTVENKATIIRNAITYLKTTPAVTLVGKGGAYELLEKYASQFEEKNNE